MRFPFRTRTTTTAIDVRPARRNAIAEVVTAAAALAAKSDRPLAFLLSRGADMYCDDDVPSWADDAIRMQHTWHMHGVELPYRLVDLWALARDLPVYEDMWTAQRRVDELQEAMTAAGLTAWGPGDAAQALSGLLTGPAATQRKSAAIQLGLDVEARLATLLQGTTEVARTTVSSDSSEDVTVVAADRIVIVRAELTTGHRYGGFSRDLMPLEVRMRTAEAVFLAGQQVTATADRDGRVTLQVAGHRLTIAADQAAAALAAIGAAVGSTQQ